MTCRIDLFLKRACLLKQRWAAAELAELGLVRINGTEAKPGSPVKVGDVIAWFWNEEWHQVTVQALPPEKGNLSKQQAKGLFTGSS